MSCPNTTVCSSRTWAEHRKVPLGKFGTPFPSWEGAPRQARDTISFVGRCPSTSSGHHFLVGRCPSASSGHHFLVGNGGGGGSRTPVRKALRHEAYMLSSIPFGSPATLRMSKKRSRLVRWFSPEPYGPKGPGQLTV